MIVIKFTECTISWRHHIIYIQLFQLLYCVPNSALFLIDSHLVGRNDLYYSLLSSQSQHARLPMTNNQQQPWLAQLSQISPSAPHQQWQAMRPCLFGLMEDGSIQSLILIRYLYIIDIGSKTDLVHVLQLLFFVKNNVKICILYLMAKMEVCSQLPYFFPCDINRPKANVIEKDTTLFSLV